MAEMNRAEAQAAGLTAEILLDTKSVLFSPDEPFTFTSGRKSPVYVDCRRLISFPRARERLMDLAVELIGREIGRDAIDVVAGGETAGIPFAAFIAERLGLPMVYVRKEPKGFGRNAQIEGEMAAGSRVLLVEDLASEGTSKLNFVRALRRAGGECTHAFVVFNYGIYPQSMASLAAEGVRLHALATWWDVLRVAEGLGAFTPQQYAAVRAYLENPDAWPAAGAAAPSPRAAAP
jgi:orotate phosphoribosyltransferase